MSTTVKIIPRKVFLGGVEQNLSEKSIKWVEQEIIKDSGESLEDALERLYIEDTERDANNKPKAKPNTLDHYFISQ